MIDNASMTELIRQSFPDAQVEIWDRTGTMDHFDVLIRSQRFAGKSPLDRHRMVEKALAEARADGRIHAMAIRTELLES
jgi:stress-induced morphogen